MKMIPLNEAIFGESEIIIEQAKDGKPKRYFIEGPFIQSEIRNKNNRKYVYEWLKPEVDRYIREMINTNRAVGELGHPTSPTINYDRASHKIISLKEDGHNWIGKGQILSGSMGPTVIHLIEDGVKFGNSTRGMGTLKESADGNIVQRDYRLATAGDIVSDPSAPDAFVNAMMENKEWIWNNGIFVEAELAEHKKFIENAKAAELEEVALKIFQNFMGNL